ncbi:MAG: putative toxin-antitoxin system toxin component, PIN family [Candidatus Eremiobacteraeota bacterium]|nr:putative toxin-antitoxin system toxin component, PIN family [Candidatus Eremiobacteraeota bacterium]
MPKSKHTEKKSAPRVVIDTNVFVSGTLNPDNLPGKILFLMACPGTFEHLISREIFLEYSEVIRRAKFRLSNEKIDAALKVVLDTAIVLSPGHSFVISPDPDDNKFLECAFEGKAHFLVTGNKKHFPFPTFYGTKIVTPEEFIALIKPDEK